VLHRHRSENNRMTKRDNGKPLRVTQFTRFTGFSLLVLPSVTHSTTSHPNLTTIERIDCAQRKQDRGNCVNPMNSVTGVTKALL
jgi:hypothetical protein